MEVSARAKQVRVSPRKVRLVLVNLPGKRVEDVLHLLRYTPTPSARLVAKVVKSAAANAENNFQIAPEGLRIKAAWADEAPRYKRMRPRARGRGSRVLHRTSHITVIVEEEAQLGP
jgi:large subunit ribosomal protein L22